jgi:hypothetical protein
VHTTHILAQELVNLHDSITKLGNDERMFAGKVADQEEQLEKFVKQRDSMKAAYERYLEWEAKKKDLMLLEKKIAWAYYNQVCMLVFIFTASICACVSVCVCVWGGGS